ncbi:Phosphoenolpyruvate/pyruvate domain-containing protein [Karstenula rhodostoma CBS 690.94]|uniref:Phosphoenolpyruvate/pyruvate domain-containing protein n=1 Tax=Karstenula rhodostoma CBS 690.94 TaxID=1392251 RepID=A0A9P4PD72_9PLEO|nr:Phosphoenolpyruvate/pyruvate domain-containing protein [Karstenula rhodostoma CBS 690.94]
MHAQEHPQRRKYTSFGLWQTLPGANVSRTLARAGVDWVLVDCEHGNIDAIAACGVSPIAPPGALDAEAHGILIPLLRTADEAKAIVSAAKFPPLGRRGLGSPFAMESFSPVSTMTEYLQQANDSLLTMMQIETQEAVDNIDKIAAVPAFISCHPILNGVMKPELEQALDKVLEATHKAGEKAGFFASSSEQAKKYAEKGFDMVSAALDTTLLQASLATSLSIARGVALSTSGERY